MSLDDATHEEWHNAKLGLTQESVKFTGFHIPQQQVNEWVYKMSPMEGKSDDSKLVRSFDSGATRSGDAGRYDPEGFLSPIVLERYCEYMQKHRSQPDGSVRDSDNWQKGLPLATYAKGLLRHILHFWTRHRGFNVRDAKAAADIEEDLLAIIFNAQGYLFELLKDKR